MGERDEKPTRNRDRYRRWAPEITSGFPMIPYPGDAKITVKQIAYLHAYCKQSPVDVANRFPRHLSLGQVHLALAHYFLADKVAIDAELAREFRLNTRDALLENALSLPPVGLESLVDSTRSEAMMSTRAVAGPGHAALPRNPPRNGLGKSK